MISLPVDWKVVVLAATAIAVGLYVWQCERSKERLAQSIAVAEVQNRENARKALADIKAKEHADENYQRRIARLASDVKRLRDAGARIVPAAAPDSPSADRACFDRAELNLALRGFADGAARLIAEGAEAVEALEAAKEWARR